MRVSFLGVEWALSRSKQRHMRRELRASMCSHSRCGAAEGDRICSSFTSVQLAISNSALLALLIFPFYRGEPFIRKLEQIAPLVKPSCMLTVASSFPVSDIRAMLFEEVTVTATVSEDCSLLF